MKLKSKKSKLAPLLLRTLFAMTTLGMMSAANATPQLPRPQMIARAFVKKVSDAIQERRSIYAPRTPREGFGLDSPRETRWQPVKWMREHIFDRSGKYVGPQ